MVGAGPDDGAVVSIADLSNGVRRARKRSLGVLPRDEHKPLIAIANSYSQLNLAHLNFNRLAVRVREGVESAGGIPIEFGIPAICDSMGHGNEHQKHVLPSREVMADAIETYIRAHGVFDGMVCLGTCDKVIPAILMAAGRTGMPTIVVTGGPSNANANRQATKQACCAIKSRRTFEIPAELLEDEKYVKQLYLEGKLSCDEFVELYHATLATTGVCRPYATAGTMICFTEALGMSLSGSGLVPEHDQEKDDMARLAGERVVDLVRGSVGARTVITRQSVENGLRCVMAIGGAKNVILHAIAVARSAGVRMSFDDVERISRSTPLLVDLKNEFPRDITGFHQAGGVRGVLTRLRHLLNLDCRTVDNVPLRTLVERHGEVDPTIRSCDAPLRTEGGVVVLRGNLAPKGSLLNVCNLPAERRAATYVRNAQVFNSHEEFFAAAVRDALIPKAAILVRYEGPVGGPGMREAHRISEWLAHLNKMGDDFLLITDGRFSGASSGFIIGLVCPEASDPTSLLGLVEDGDQIEICLRKYEINLLVPASTLQDRRSSRKGGPQPIPEGHTYLHRYRRLVTSADQGAVLWDGTDVT